MLDAARDVAHGVERKITPVSTFLLGMNVERRVSAVRPARRRWTWRSLPSRRLLPA